MDEKDNNRWHKEGDPAHHDEHGGGEVDGEDEGTQGATEQDLKPVRTVVACKIISKLAIICKEHCQWNAPDNRDKSLVHL